MERQNIALPIGNGLPSQKGISSSSTWGRLASVEATKSGGGTARLVRLRIFGG
jgi:hypothetical protein